MSPNPVEVGSLVRAYTSERIDRRQFLSRAVALGLSASAASTLLAACGSSPTSTKSATSTTFTLPTTTLTYRPEVDIANLDPAFYVSQDDVIIADCILEGLVTYKPGTFDMVNNLADTFEISSDKLQYHFKLKPGIEWQKGYGEVRASDVKFSYERIAGLTKPKLNSPYSGDWQALETVRVEGPYEGTIILKEPFAPLLHSTMPVGSGKVVPEKAVKALGKKWATNIVGSGPWQFDSWVPGQRTKLSRFEKYSGANSAYAVKVPWTSIETAVISSDTTAFSSMETGSPLLCWLGTSVVSKAQATTTLSLFSRPTQAFYFLSMNVLDPVLKNKNLRKAVRSAIDVPGIISAAYNGHYTRAYGIIPPSMSIGYWPNAPHYNQDPSLAKSYLSSSGLSKVSLKLNVQNDDSDEAAAQIIASNLGDVGINVSIEPESSATYYAIPGAGGGGAHRQLNYTSYVTEPDPYWSFIWFTCSQMGLWNWSDWCDPRFTSLVNDAFRTYDVATRDKLYIQAAQLWDNEAAIAWICYPTWYYVAQPHVVPSLRPDGLPFLWQTTVS